MPADYSIPTANDILSYRGDPGLAAGAGTGLSPIQVNPLGGVDSTLDKIQQINAQKAIMDYQQKAKDQEDLAKMLRETGGSVFNMKGPGGQNISYTPLPEDMKILNAKAHELRRMTLEHPDNYEFNEDWLDKKKEYDNLVNHAGVRAYAYSNYNTDAAKTNDQEERNRIMGMRQSEIGNHPLTDYYMPEPHLPGFTSNMENILPEKTALDKNNQNTFRVKTGKDAAGNLLFTELNGLKDNVLDRRQDIFPGSPGWADAVNYTKNYFQHIAANPSLVQQQNTNIDRINQQRGYVDENGNPINQHYIPHVADVVQGPNGPQVVPRTTNPADVVHALIAEKYGSLQGDVSIKKTADELQKEYAGISDAQQKINLERQKLAEEERYHNGLLAKGEKPNTEQLKDIMYKKQAISAFDDVHKVWNEAFQADKPYSQKVVEIPKYPQFWKDRGIDPTEYNFYPDITQKKADSFIGLEAPQITETTKAGESTPGRTTKYASASQIPTKVFPIENKKTGEKKLVFMDGDKVLNVVDEKNAVINKLKHDAQYDQKIYENPTVWVSGVMSGDVKPEIAPQPQAQAALPVTSAPRNPIALDASKITGRLMESGKKIAVIDGKKYEVVGKKKSGELIGIPIE